MGLVELFTFSNELVFRIRLGAYGVLLFFSLVIIGGTAAMKNETHFFDCPLYCNRKGTFYKCGDESTCNFPMAIAIIFQIMYLSLRFGSMILVMLGKLNTDSFPFTDPFEFIYVIIELVAAFLTFIGACLLTAGTNSTCSNIPHVCDSDILNEWKAGSSVGQAGSWISFFIWLAVGLIGLLYILREGRIPFLSGAGAGNTSTSPDVQNDRPMEAPPGNPVMPPPRFN